MLVGGTSGRGPYDIANRSYEKNSSSCRLRRSKQPLQNLHKIIKPILDISELQHGVRIGDGFSGTRLSASAEILMVVHQSGDDSTLYRDGSITGYAADTRALGLSPTCAPVMVA